MSQQALEKNKGTVEQTRTAREVAPPVDIFEGEQDFQILADLPGVEVDGVNVQLEPPELRLTARRANDESLSYARSFRVDDRLDPNGVTAELKDGVLTIRLKKSAELTPRRIAVKTG